jgi:hypothetical protein
VSAPTHPSSNPRFTPQWPTSKGDPIYPCWSYGGRTGMYQADALRMMAHDLVETIRQLTMPFDELIEQSREKEGVDTGVFMTRLWKKVEDQKRELARLNEKLSAADEPSADAEKILEAYDACWIEDETGGHSRRTMDQLRDIGKRFNDARAAVLAAMRPAPPSTTRQDRRYVPGDYVHTEGKNAIALECPHVHVMYEDGTVERRPLHCTSRSTEEPRGVTIEMLTQARSKLSTAVPPREGYSQAYADQMRTALLRIAGWREIDRNSLGERLREIEEIALAALMPTVTKSAESSPQGVQHGLAHREDETGRYSVPGESVE